MPRMFLMIVRVLVPDHLTVASSLLYAGRGKVRQGGARGICCRRRQGAAHQHAVRLDSSIRRVYDENDTCFPEKVMAAASLWTDGQHVVRDDVANCTCTLDIKNLLLPSRWHWHWLQKQQQSFQQSKVHVRRDFRKAAASIGASLKADVAAYHGRRDLAELSPWFEAFASPAGAYVQRKCV